jgi:DnaJ domain
LEKIVSSKLFDSIRMKPTRSSAAKEAARCEHPGCEEAGAHKAPKGRSFEGQYLLLCIKHVQEYNKSFNYFNGMDDEKVRAYQKDSVTGHRPTWAMGIEAKADPNAYVDTLEILKKAARSRTARVRATVSSATGPKRPVVGNAARKAFETMGLDETADKAAIRTKYKELVKRLHPDANAGDRSNEGRMMAVIEAYNYFKTTGFV